MIVVPFFSAWHAPLVEAALSAGGEECRAGRKIQNHRIVEKALHDMKL